jgi:single-strand DNA-binding protein
MRGVNKVILIGRLGADPEIRKVEGMRSKLTLRMATTESYKNAQGEWQDITDWHTVVMWGPMAERCERELHKGSLVYVEGKLRTRSWEDKEGHKRYVTEVLADYFQNLTPRDGGSGYREHGAQAASEEPPVDYTKLSDEGNDGLPF